MPNCYTPIEELIYTLGGPWLFTILLSSALVLLALVLSVARMKLIGNDDFTGPAPAPVGGHIDHSFPFLESLNEVIKDHFFLFCLNIFFSNLTSSKQMLCLSRVDF